MLLSYDGEEEKVIDTFLATLNTGREKFEIQKVEQKSVIRHKNISLDLEQRKVFRGDTERNLSYTEFEIFQLLAQYPGKVFSKEQIYDLVWKEPYSGDYNIVMSHIHHIREKIEDDPAHPVYIQTVWGVGYKFNELMSSEV